MCKWILFERQAIQIRFSDGPSCEPMRIVRSKVAVLCASDCFGCVVLEIHSHFRSHFGSRVPLPFLKIRLVRNAAVGPAWCSIAELR